MAAEGLADLFDFVHSDFAAVHQRADVVFFEFCLHEMVEPGAMVMHGLDLAPDVLVIDHDRQSEWAWHACETEKVEQSWSAVERFAIERSRSSRATQEFESHSQLVDKISCMGDTAIGRARRFEGVAGIEIPMGYRIALLTEELR